VNGLSVVEDRDNVRFRIFIPSVNKWHRIFYGHNPLHRQLRTQPTMTKKNNSKTTDFSIGSTVQAISKCGNKGKNGIVKGRTASGKIKVQIGTVLTSFAPTSLIRIMPDTVDDNPASLFPIGTMVEVIDPALYGKRGTIIGLTPRGKLRVCLNDSGVIRNFFPRSLRATISGTGQGPNTPPTAARINYITSILHNNPVSKRRILDGLRALHSLDLSFHDDAVQEILGRQYEWIRDTTYVRPRPPAPVFLPGFSPSPGPTVSIRLRVGNDQASTLEIINHPSVKRHSSRLKKSPTHK
jgi:hypothetical protein